MAKNTGEGFRRGAVIDRSQTYNPKTEQWVKRDAENGPKTDGSGMRSRTGRRLRESEKKIDGRE